MHTFTTPSLALAALAVLPAVSAHGYVSGIVAGGKWYPGSNPNWYYNQATKPTTAGWYALNQDNGFVSPDAFATSDIICHKSATPGSTSIPVTAGSTIQLQWNTWPDSHHGPVMDYLAKCANGDCTKVDKTTLSFFKSDAGGLINDDSPPGKWASDQLLANNFTWSLKIPSVASGQYVLRHEIIGLHSAGNANGAQNYPQCINLAITGGTLNPCSSGAVCQSATKFYTASDPGILINIYQSLKSYTIPGPAIWSGLKKRSSRVFRA